MQLCIYQGIGAAGAVDREFVYIPPSPPSSSSSCTFFVFLLQIRALSGQFWVKNRSQNIAKQRAESTPLEKTQCFRNLLLAFGRNAFSADFLIVLRSRAPMAIIRARNAFHSKKHSVSAKYLQNDPKKLPLGTLFVLHVYSWGGGGGEGGPPQRGSILRQESASNPSMFSLITFLTDTTDTTFGDDSVAMRGGSHPLSTRAGPRKAEAWRKAQTPSNYYINILLYQ